MLNVPKLLYLLYIGHYFFICQCLVPWCVLYVPVFPFNVLNTKKQPVVSDLFLKKDKIVPCRSFGFSCLELFVASWSSAFSV